jgi:hypothetical protein
MSDQSGSWPFLVGTAFFVIVLLLIISPSIKVLRKLKRAGGARGVVAKWRAKAATHPPSRAYPLVSPVSKTNKLLWNGGCMTLLGLLLIGAGWFAQRAHIRQMRLLESETVTTMARITNKTIVRGGVRLAVRTMSPMNYLASGRFVIVWERQDTFNSQAVTWSD